MFNKDGIPFFIILIPFLCVLFLSAFLTSYYLKINNEQTQTIKELILTTDKKQFINKKIELLKIEIVKNEDKIINFIISISITILLFIAGFSYLMMLIVNDVIKKYKDKVKKEENKLQYLNQTLEQKVQKGIEEAKQKDKKILEQAKLARIGSMISMIAHQWRQPLSQLSAILMEIQTAAKFKKLEENKVLSAIDRSDNMIDFMSNTIDDFRNFYKPDKKKDEFWVSFECYKAINIIKATLDNLGITLNINILKDKKIYGYPSEFSQVILNILSNAKDILVEKEIQNPTINFTISTDRKLIIIEIEDNACGIDLEDTELIFDPYFSTKDTQKGTGLGLYISKLIIERNMGGELSVYNSANGAVFKIVLVG